MIIDSRLQVSTDQALTATAVSTDVIDTGAAARDLGAGEDLYLVVCAKTALAGTSPTLQVQVQTDDNSSFSSARTIGSGEVLTAVPIGTQIVIELPRNNERYMRVNYVLGGTTPTIIVDAFVTVNPPSYKAYPGAIPG